MPVLCVLRNAAWELILRKRNKLQVESALRASSALAGAQKEMCILELIWNGDRSIAHVCDDWGFPAPYGEKLYEG